MMVDNRMDPLQSLPNRGVEYHVDFSQETQRVQRKEPLMSRCRRKSVCSTMSATRSVSTQQFPLMAMRSFSEGEAPSNKSRMWTRYRLVFASSCCGQGG